MTSTPIVELNELLKGELAAADTYTEVLPKIDDDATKSILEECRDSHARRALKLRGAIKDLGGTPESNAGVWEGFTKLATDSASALGDVPAVAMLEEGEDLGLSDYEWRLVRMHGDHRKLVKDELWPEQQDTKQKVSQLLNSLTGGKWPPVPGKKVV